MLQLKRLSLIASAALMGCGRTSTAPAPLPDTLRLVPVVKGLASPVYLTAPAGDSRLFIVEQRGRIRVVKNGALLPTPHLDITAKVRFGGEQGLLGMAFHPSFPQNGFFYVNYTDLAGDTRIERYQATPSSDVANPASAFLILGFDQPFANHNGGMLLFGPDGMLWIGTGDGGSGGDPLNHAQTRSSFLGRMLRIDVNGGSPYAIPPNNPFVGQANARGEIWGLGLRNPWRYAFDHAAGLLYVADVGQNLWEEIHVVEANRPAVNYGWKIMEGKHCFQATSCDHTGLDVPIVEYGRGDGCSITGGFVYRGNAVPGVRGHYFFSDYCVGFLRSFKLGSTREGIVPIEWQVGDVGNVTSFGEDGAGELYVLSANGRAYRLSG